MHSGGNGACVMRGNNYVQCNTVCVSFWHGCAFLETLVGWKHCTEALRCHINNLVFVESWQKLQNIVWY